MVEETIKPTGNVQLAGFSDIDSSTMSILNKNIGNHAKRIAELTKKMELLHITLKPVHEREKGGKYEVHAKVIDDGKVYASKTTERNLFVAVDSVLKKIENELD